MPQYTIGGCQVHFPHQAYGTQLSFMSKVIAALEGGHNALLEAPTGSGKTLSLLCSALAWQVREKQRIEEGLAAEKASLAAAMVAAAAEAAADDDPITDPDAACCGSGGGGKGEMTPGCSAPPNPDDPPPCSDAPTSPGDGGFMPAGEGGAEEAPPVRRKAPKIFYATRTHSQIAQVVKELKRSEFRPRMAVLGSRKHYCINQRATRQSSVDEACEELLKESQCQYFKNVHSFVNSGYQYRLHSIEDLKGFGKTAKACPYYTARKWVDEAEVIFAPYSYLLDPVIRRAMAVDVQGCMLIFDEAHNIEDVCREAASTEVELDTMLEVLACFHKAFELNGKQEVYGPLRDCAQKTVNWMRDKERAAVAHTEQQRAGGGGGGRGRGRGGRGGVAASRQDPYERLFPARQMMAELEACGLGPDTIDALWEAYQAAREEEEAMSDNVKGGASGDVNKENKDNPAAGPTANTAVRVGALALGVMSRLVQVVRMLHQGSDDGARDYRLVVQRQYEKEPGLAMGRYKPRGRGGEEEGDGDGGASSLPGYTFKLCLWSMNPAVAFRPVAEEAHSVVLTSGTLAPLEGFASELGTPFNITLEAPHVVDMRRQVWAGVVGTGPGGTPLIATFKNQVEPAFQDAVGRVILEAAAAVPDGLLVFMPSYSLLDRLLTRWKTTGALKQLGELKHVVQEPRGGGQDALKKCMTEYYDAVARGGGAVFFAVCRGKVSEGLDFADGNARGVIIVGIPFPAVKDLKVNEKKGFNDRNQRALNLVSGDTWYSQQAFRALNQALGRCIRHRLDWGAIMMVDERFKQPRNQKMLSRWVRGALTVHPTFEAGLGNMRSFFSTIQANPPGPPQGQQQQQAAGDPAEAAAIAAAVAAAVAAAGQAAPAPAPEQPAGRGVEGALHGTASQWGKNTAMGMLQMWQQKPLGQARVAAGQQQPQGGPGLFEWQQSAKTPPGGAAAAVAGMYAVKQEPGSGAGQQQQGQQQQGQQQQGQQLGALPAVKPEPQQWPAGAQQPQQHLPPPQQRRQSGAPPLPLQQAGAPLIKPEPQQWPAHLQHHQQHCGVKQEPQQWEAGPQLQHPAQQLQQQQQGKGPSPPHHEAAWQQHAPQQWQPVIGHHARPTSEDEGRGLPAGSAAALAAAVGEAPLAAWVCADVADCMAFLRGQGLDQPGMLPAGFSSLLHVAVGGVRDAFDAAREYLGQQRPLHHLAAEWGCALPRGLQAVLAAGPAALPGGKPYDQAALAYGQQRLRAGWAPAALVAAVSEAYSESLDALLSGRVQVSSAGGDGQAGVPQPPQHAQAPQQPLSAVKPKPQRCQAGPQPAGQQPPQQHPQPGQHTPYGAGSGGGPPASTPPMQWDVQRQGQQQGHAPQAGSHPTGHPGPHQLQHPQQQHWQGQQQQPGQQQPYAPHPSCHTAGWHPPAQRAAAGPPHQHKVFGSAPQGQGQQVLPQEPQQQQMLQQMQQGRAPPGAQYGGAQPPLQQWQRRPLPGGPGLAPPNLHPPGHAVPPHQQQQWRQQQGWNNPAPGAGARQPQPQQQAAVQGAVRPAPQQQQQQAQPPRPAGVPAPNPAVPPAQQPHASGLPAPAQGQVQHVGNKRGAGAEPDAAAKRRYLRGPNAEAAAQQRTAGADDGAAAALGAAKGAALAQAVYGDSSEDDFK